MILLDNKIEIFNTMGDVAIQSDNTELLNQFRKYVEENGIDTEVIELGRTTVFVNKHKSH